MTMTTTTVSPAAAAVARTTIDNNNVARYEIDLERSLAASGVGNERSLSDEETRRIPVVDMSAPPEEVAEDAFRAARDVGFFTIVDHGVSSDLVDAAFAASERYFARPRADKEADSPFSPALNSGYEYMTQVRPSTGTADRKESLQITARRGCMDGRWPKERNNDDEVGLREVALEFAERAHELARRVLSRLEEAACPHLSLGTLANAHGLWNDDGQCTLRFLHYPPMEAEEWRELTHADDYHWRAGPHTDWGCVTLLFQRPGESGLECRANPRRAAADPNDDAWIPVPPVPGGIAVNVGDMLSRWSGGALYSNLHRVRMPRNEEESARSRYSIAFFMQADRSAVIRPPDGGGEPVTAGDYILGRIKSNY